MGYLRVHVANPGMPDSVLMYSSLPDPHFPTEKERQDLWEWAYDQFVLGQMMEGEFAMAVALASELVWEATDAW